MGRYAIAGLKVDMDCSGRTRKQAEAYAAPAEGPADMEIVCDVAHVLERNPQITTEDMAEYLGSAMVFAKELLNFDGMYLHASAVVLEGKAYLFSAPSGTGKSTHTEKWCRLFGATYLNDDKPVLRLIDGVWMAYGTPWSGKHDLSAPIGVPLGGLIYIHRGQENTIRKLSPEEAVPRLMSQTLWRHKTPDSMEKQLALLDKLLRQFPLWLLSCRNDDAAAFVSKSAVVDGV